MNAHDSSNDRDESDVEGIDGPTGKPSQAEGGTPDAAAQASEPLPAEGHPSQAEGEDPDA